ncbi:hypothetical protein HYN59_05730 [Flavobacterium album]|uniref:HYR domain-containing protein n=2 Tax=Flavobacterium album TaxID=2175091 RepID=A0A2S1QW61_9FLAO|nr:hypothetical protein HYN59_05730 [Flavobacterium album]
MTTPSEFIASNFTGGGAINFNYELYSGFGGQNWSTAGIDYGKYFQVNVKAGAGKKIQAKHFTFTYYGQCNAFKVVYQKSSAGVPSDASFSTNGTALTTVINAQLGNDKNVVLPFGSDVVVTPGETLYIRVYPYMANPNDNKWFLRHANEQNEVANSNSNGPAIYGVVSDATGVTAVEDTDTAFENTAVTRNVTANDIATGTTINPSIQIVAPLLPASEGVATVNGTSITFTPTTSTGAKVITYKITGADGSTSTSTYTVTVSAYPSPTANADVATTGKNIPVTIPVLNNDVAGSGTIGTIAITAQPASGTATVSGSNIIYTPAATFTGTAVISYTVTNSNNKVSNVATVTVTVVNIVGPTANADTVSTSKNNPVTFNPIANDTAGNSAITTLTILTNPAHGTASVNAATNTITFTPANNYTGTDSFTYKITDAYNATATATVNISVLQPTTTGPLCGTYVISATTQYEYPQFTSLTAAIAHLNANGVSCPVTFLLKDNNYNESTGESFPLVINQFAGTSTVNTVTFKPAPAKNVTIKVNDITINSSAYQATTVFQFNGADNIIFDGSNTVNGSTRNLTVFNNNTLNYLDRAVFWVASNGSNGANNITIKHTNIRQGYRNQDGKYTIGVFAGSNTIENPDTVNNRNLKVSQQAGANNSNMYLWDNDFMNVKQGVYVNGGTTVTTGVNIFQNDLGAENNTESVILPVTLNNVSNFSVSENQIYRLYRTTTDGDLLAGGINIKGNTTNGSITKNNMSDLQRLTADANTFAGIVLASTSTNSNILVANNFILDPVAKGNSGGYSNGYGIIVDNGGGYRILNNTVVLSKSQPLGGYSAALYVNSNASNLDVRNNIFVNSQTNTATRRCAIIVNNDTDNLNAVFTKLDYNNYYSSDRIGYIANIHLTDNITWPENPDYVQTFEGWKGALLATNNTANANNKDTHSLSVNPSFMSATDLHLGTANSSLNDKGTPIAEITKDIDGQLRSLTTPDMGADEFGAIAMPVPGSNTGVYCDSSTTWNGTSWSNGLPAANKDVIFSGDKTFISENIYACSIYVMNGASVNFISESNAFVTHNVNVQDGSKLTFESSSNLMQTENTQNNGTVTIKRNSSKLKRLDYVMWASPVTGTQTLLQFSPQTLLNRFYVYNYLSNMYAPLPDPSAVVFAKAKGYLIRMPNNHPATTPTVFQGSFTGTPNNGNVYYPLQYQSSTIGYNAVGNPYPSPISVTAFIDANIDNIEGTLWLWRKTNDWTQSSYSTLTKTGYTANAAPGGSSADNDLIADPFEIAPGIGVLNTAQGFIVKAKNTQNLVFRNNMRLSTNYVNFFRTANDNEDPAVPVQYEMSRFWLNVKGADTDFSQTLIAYSPQGTLGYDNGFDGVALDGANIDISSVITENGEQMKLAIQTRPEFAISDSVQLGFTAAVAGTFTFELDHYDGLFGAGDQPIYLVDNLTGTMQNLRNGSYTFTSEIGTFDERFKVVYATDEELGTDIPVLDSKEVIVYRSGSQVSIKSPQDIKSVTVYDTLGRVLYNNGNVNAAEFVTPNIDSAQQVVIVKMVLENQQVISKKIMMN